MGSFLGLQVTAGGVTSLVWLRDAGFTRAQRYTQPDAPVPETTFTSAALGLVVVVTDIVSPDVDLLTRRVVVTRQPGSPVTAANLVLYENLSPTLSRIAQLPFADWALDAHNDFAAGGARARAIGALAPAPRCHFALASVMPDVSEP